MGANATLTTHPPGGNDQVSELNAKLENERREDKRAVLQERTARNIKKLAAARREQKDVRTVPGSILTAVSIAAVHVELFVTPVTRAKVIRGGCSFCFLFLFFRSFIEAIDESVKGPLGMVRRDVSGQPVFGGIGADHGLLENQASTRALGRRTHSSEQTSIAPPGNLLAVVAELI